MNRKSLSLPTSGRTYLLLAIVIFGAANAITRKLTELGAENLVEGRNPISFCNVLFVGNLCAFILLLIIYQRQWRVPLLKQISLKSWLTLTLVAILGTVIVPTLIFTALSQTNVNNVVLIGQIDTPLVLALSVWLLKDKVNHWVVMGAIVSFIGVSLTVALRTPDSSSAVSMGMGLAIGKGELLTIIAAVFKAVASLISKVSLKQIPLGIFSVFRMFLGTIIFFILATVLYGVEHFRDLTSTFLWQWMLIYSAVIVVGGQLFWFSGLKLSSASEVSLATAFNPIAGILAAYWILGEAPTTAQYLGGVVILAGIALNQIGVLLLNKKTSTPQPIASEMDSQVSFKGI
ncbi:MAG: DMT family transporter [Xenococcaceae cyanobacterium]